MNKIERFYFINKKNQNLKRVIDAFDPTKDTKVLILCLTYNHEKYIQKCIDSMLNQKVDFNVKIIIHDDNSDDATSEIVKEYEKKYQDIITVIRQNKNLYSEEHALLPIFLFLKKYMEGKYIAVCEGDDYWTNPLKVKTQVDIFDSFSDCHFCTHKVDVISNKSSKVLRTIPNKKYRLKSGLISEDRFIELACKRYLFQTSSYMFKKDDFVFYLNNLPEFANIMPTEDESLLLYFGQLGKTYYINKVFSHYLKYSEGSWTNGNDAKSISKKNERLSKMISALKSFNTFTNNRFKKQCDQRIIKHEIGILLNNGDFDTIFKKMIYRVYFKKRYPKDYYSVLIKRLFKKN